MAQSPQTAFFSYCRDDSDFALRLVADLKAVGAGVWLDQLDISPGQRWDRAVEEALTNCPRMVVILSPASVSSTTVMDEVSFALEEQKTVIPILYRECTIPFRLRRVQYVDFRQDYPRGLQDLLRTLAPDAGTGQSNSTVSEAHDQPRAADSDDRTTDQAQREDTRRKAVAPEAERAPLETQPADQTNRKKRFAILGGTGAAAIILIVAVAWLVFHFGSAAPREPAAGQHAPAEHWKVLSSGTQNNLDSIFATSDGARLWVVGSDGEIRESDDGGQHWTARNSGTHSYLHAILGAADGRRLWAVGEEGAILESEDGGEHWTARAGGAQNILESIFVTSDGKRLWIVGAKGTILESDDGGENWAPRRSRTQKELTSIFGTGDGQRVWTVGSDGAILESDDGGALWTARISGTQTHLRSIFGTSDGQRLWVGGNDGAILASDDSGEHWTARRGGNMALPALFSIFGTSDGRRLWAVGAKGTILASDDGGEHWTARNSGPYALHAIFGTSDASRLWAVGAEGTLLESTTP